MHEREANEISLGSGKSQVVLKGREAIRAAGWALRLLLISRAVATLTVSIAGIIWLVWRLWPG
jgi:hypothetical protein